MTQDVDTDAQVTPEAILTVATAFMVTKISAGDKEVVRRFDELCTPDMVNHALAPDRPSGIEGTRQFLAASRRGQRPLRWVSCVVVAEGDYVIQYGTRSGEWSGRSFRSFSVPSGP